MGDQNKLVQLNVGCGRDIQEGWINLDAYPLPGVDIVFDLEKCAEEKIPLGDSSVDRFLLSHLIEHIEKVLPLMAELHRIAKPGAKAVIRVPYGSSDDAFEDPTHIRQYYIGSFGYFSQPYYWRADYGYRGDWQPNTITLFIEGRLLQGKNSSQIMEMVMHQRNIVREMMVELEAVKPLRQPLRELQKNPDIKIQAV